MYKCYSDFGKKVLIEYNNCSEEAIQKVDFWIKKFTPNVKEVITSNGAFRLFINNCNNYCDVYESKTFSTLTGNVDSSTSSIGKYISQIFQRLLINDGIIFVHASCVALENKGVIILGDYAQGKTSIALGCNNKDNNITIVSDNGIAIKDGRIIGGTNYISLRNNNTRMLSQINKDNTFNHINRVYYDYTNDTKRDLEIVSIIDPHINAEDNSKYVVDKELAKLYMYEKFSNLIKGETLLFNGRFPTKSYANNNNLQIIINEIDYLNNTVGLKYISCRYDEIIESIVGDLYGKQFTKRL